MDEQTQAWCEANGSTGHTVKALITEEFVSMQAIRAMTADASFSLSSAQRCLLRKAVLKSQSPLPLPPPVPTSATKDAKNWPMISTY